MAAARLATGAAAPFAFAAAMNHFGTTISLFVIAALGSFGILAFGAVATSVRRERVAG